MELHGHGEGVIEDLGLFLGEVGHVHVGPHGAFPTQGGQLAQQQPDEGGLAGAVGPDQGQFLAPLDDEIDVGQHRFAVVADAHIVQLGHHPGAALGFGKGEPGGQFHVGGQLGALQTFEGLEPALHLAGLGGLVAESLHEFLDVGDLALLGGRGGAQLSQTILALHDELGEATYVFGGGAVGQLDHPLGHRVDEVTVVGDEQDGPLVGGQGGFQPGHRVGVEVVGGLVQHQDIGLVQHQASQSGAHLPATGELPHRSFHGLVGETEPGQDALSFRLQGVTAELLEAALGLAVGVQGPLVGRAGGGGQLLLQVVQRQLEFVDGACPGQHRGQDRLTGIRGAHRFLGQVADPGAAGAMDLTPVGVLEAQHDFQQGGFPLAVAPDQGNASPRQQAEGDVTEQLLTTVCFGQPRDGDHEEGRLPGCSRRSGLLAQRPCWHPSGGAAFPEGGDALNAFLGVEQRGRQGGGPFESGPPIRELGDPADQRLRGGQGVGPAQKNLGDDLAHLGVELGRGHRVVDEPDLYGSGGADPLAGEEQLERVGPAQLGQTHHRDDRGGHADAHLGEAQLSLRRHDGDVTAGGQAHPTGQGVAVDASDDRLGAVENQIEDV